MAPILFEYPSSPDVESGNRNQASHSSLDADDAVGDQMRYLLDVLETSAKSDSEATGPRPYPFDFDTCYQVGLLDGCGDKSYPLSNFDGLEHVINGPMKDFDRDDDDDDATVSTKEENLDDATVSTREETLDEDDEDMKYLTGQYPLFDNGTTHFRLLIHNHAEFFEELQLENANPVTGESQYILESLIERNFDPLNDIRQHPVTGDLWFIDIDWKGMIYDKDWDHPDRARSTPRRVYRYVPETAVVSVVKNGFAQWNALDLAPDLRPLSITDRDAQSSDANATRRVTVYEFDVSGDNITLRDRRAFEYVDTGLL